MAENEGVANEEWQVRGEVPEERLPVAGLPHPLLPPALEAGQGGAQVLQVPLQLVHPPPGSLGGWRWRWRRWR